MTAKHVPLTCCVLRGRQNVFAINLAPRRVVNVPSVRHNLDNGNKGRMKSTVGQANGKKHLLHYASEVFL